LQETRLAQFLAASQIWFYWIALLITIFSGAIYFWKNAALLQESMDDSPENYAVKPTTESKPETPSAAAPLRTPAFKEWEGIVEALGQGAQIILLRKGGISEGRSGFQARNRKFWLFPTRYHQQREKTKLELRRYLAPAGQNEKEITLTYFAEVTDAIYLSSWDQVARLDDVHFWGEEILRERFSYQDRPGMEAGLHLLIVRVHRINLPHRLAPAPEYEGCKSWIDVPVDWTHDIAAPVIRTEEFATLRSRILAAVATVPAPIVAAA
jgi:hypothetical protein